MKISAGSISPSPPAVRRGFAPPAATLFAGKKESLKWGREGGNDRNAQYIPQYVTINRCVYHIVYNTYIIPTIM